MMVVVAGLGEGEGRSVMGVSPTVVRYKSLPFGV